MKFVAFRTLIENEIGNPNTADASSVRMRQLILQWAQNVYQEVGRKGNWGWLEGLQGAGSLPAGFKGVAIPSTVAKILDIMDLSEDPPLPVDFVPEHQYWESQYQTDADGIPEYYHIWDETLYFDKAPTSTWTFQYRYKGRVATLNTSDNGGLGTEILLPDVEMDIMYEGVLAYAYRRKENPMFAAQFQLYQKKLADMVDSDSRGPGCFYPEKTKERARDVTKFRVIVP